MLVFILSCILVAFFIYRYVFTLRYRRHFPSCIIIIGGTKGLGAALIREFRVYCPLATIYCVARHVPVVAHRVDHVNYVVGNVMESSQWDVETMFPDCDDAWVINCAGMARCDYFTDIENIEEVTMQMIDLNLTASIHAAHVFLRLPKTRYMMIASVLAHISIPGYSIYATSKAALKAFYEALCTEGLGERVGIVYANTMLTEGYKAEEAYGKPNITKWIESYDSPQTPDQAALVLVRELLRYGCHGEHVTSWSSIFYASRVISYFAFPAIMHDIFRFWWCPSLVHQDKKQK